MDAGPRGALSGGVQRRALGVVVIIAVLVAVGAPVCSASSATESQVKGNNVKMQDDVTAMKELQSQASRSQLSLSSSSTSGKGSTSGSGNSASNAKHDVKVVKELLSTRSQHQQQSASASGLKANPHSLFQPPYDYHLLKDFQGRPLTLGGAASDKTSPAGLVTSFLIDSRIKVGTDEDPNNPKPQRYVWAWYDKAGHRTNMVIEDNRRFEFNLESPPPFETAAINLVYYALRVDSQLLRDIRFYGKEYGYESALRRVQELFGADGSSSGGSKAHSQQHKHHQLQPHVLTNHFHQLAKDWQGNRPLRDWLPSTQQRTYFRIVLLGEKFPPRDELHKALEGALNVVVFMLKPDHLLQLWPPKRELAHKDSAKSHQAHAELVASDTELRRWLQALKRDMQGSGRAVHLGQRQPAGHSVESSESSHEESAEESSESSEDSASKRKSKKAAAKRNGGKTSKTKSKRKRKRSASKSKGNKARSSSGKGMSSLGGDAKAAAKMIANAINRQSKSKSSKVSARSAASKSSESSSTQSSEAAFSISSESSRSEEMSRSALSAA